MTLKRFSIVKYVNLPHLNLTYSRYVMTCSTPEKVEGVALLQEGCRVVEEKIKSVGGNFAIQMAPKVFFIYLKELHTKAVIL